MRRRSSSREAKKAAETVNVVLAKAGEGRGYYIDLVDEDVGGLWRVET